MMQRSGQSDVMLSRRRLFEASAALAALAPLSGVSGKLATPTDAVALAARLSKGQTTALAEVDAAIARLEAANPSLNAVSEPDYDRARTLAAGASSGPLAGLPSLIKGNIAQAGRPLSDGCRALKSRIAAEDEAVTKAALACGIIPIGRSNLPEFGLLPTSEALLTGPVANPWNLGHSAGGSSGGSAAAVAAGVVTVAHGNDGGGSIRIPASACGLVGLKASRGRMGGEGGRTRVTDFGVNGCLSRTVRDTAAWLASAEARGPGARYPAVGLVTGPGTQRLRIALGCRSAVGADPDPEVGAVFEAAARLLARLGHRMLDYTPPYHGAAVANGFSSLWSLGAARQVQAVAAMLGRTPTPDDIEPLTLSWAARGAALTKPKVDAAVETLSLMAAAYAAQFDRYDMLMTPVLALPPVALGQLDPRKSFAELEPLLLRYVAYTPIENATGAPAIALPIGQTRSGLPIGLQFTTAPGGERRLLELAYGLERELLWYQRTPPNWFGI
jgi:amidase